MQDAGTNPADHYRSRMGPVCFRFRQWALEYVRKETDILARIQKSVRTPFLDTYFASTANLGTHTFYMVMLPIFCWYGHMPIGESVVTVLAVGVYITGYVKDLLCLPRPRSPPLHRISTSGSAVQEYGFPSTHSCNAVSVILVFMVENDPPTIVYWICAILGLSIVAGRLYTGMHGFIDVGFGIVFGWIAWVISCQAIKVFHAFIHGQPSFPWMALTGLAALTAGLIIVHPQPVDPCPCYDDSVAFLAVVVGLQLSVALHYAETGAGWPDFVYRGPVRAIARFVLGVAMIVVWRLVAKRTLLKVLPPIWRFFEAHGFALPRRDYLKATEYDKVPNDLTDDILPDSPKQIASMIRTVRRTRGRSDSVGPQNIVDVYEAAAYRSSKPRSGTATPPPRDPVTIDKPRIHYDVEIVTKLIVYAGIGAIAGKSASDIYEFLGI